MKFKHGAVVYWVSPLHECGFVPDKEGKPQQFVVLDPGYKYCTLRSVDFYKKGYSFQDLPRFDMKYLVLAKDLLHNKENVKE